MIARRRSLLAVIVLAAGATAAHADAQALEREAETLAAAGDFVGAAAKYREAHRENPRPDLMCNVGVAYYKAADLPRSQRYLDQCVTSGASLDPTFIANVKAVLTAVEQKLVEGEFKPLNFIIQPAAATTTFDGGPHEEPLVGSRQVWVPFGAYKVTIHAEGYTDRVLEIAATDRTRGEYSVKLDRGVTVEAPPKTLPVEPTPRRPEPEPRSMIAPITVSAISGVAAGVAVGFFFAARGSADQANKPSVTMAEYTRHADAAESRKYIAWGAGALAAVGGIAAGILWWRYNASAPVEVSANASSASVSFVGCW